jgi:hypothetical protein
MICDTSLDQQKSAKHMFLCTMCGGGGNLPNSCLAKIREKLNGINYACNRRFLMCLSAIDLIREKNTCEIFKMINKMTREHITESIKLSRVFARNRLDSGQIPPAIFRPSECVHQNLLSPRYRYRVDGGKTHDSIYRVDAGRHFIRSVLVLPLKNVFAV